MSGVAYRNVIVGSGVAGLVSALLALRHGKVVLVARTGFTRDVPSRIDSAPVAAIAALIELGIDPRSFSDLRRHSSRLVAWSSDAPTVVKAPETVNVERGALEASLFARVLRHPGLVLVPAPRHRLDLRALLGRYARNGAVVLDATGRASVLSARRVTAPSPWYAWTKLWRAGTNRRFEDGFRLAVVADGYCYRLGTRTAMTLGLVSPARKPAVSQAERCEAHRHEVSWLFDGVPAAEDPSTNSVHAAAVQWAESSGALAVGDACLARDPLSSQGLACTISQAHHAVAVESSEDAALYESRAREQRVSHMRSLERSLSESRNSDDAPWRGYRAFVSRALEDAVETEEPPVALQGGRLGRVAGAPAPGAYGRSIRLA